MPKWVMEADRQYPPSLHRPATVRTKTGKFPNIRQAACWIFG